MNTPSESVCYEALRKIAEGYGKSSGFLIGEGDEAAGPAKFAYQFLQKHAEQEALHPSDLAWFRERRRLFASYPEHAAMLDRVLAALGEEIAPHPIEARGSEPAGPNPYYTPTIMVAFKAYKEEEYGGKLGDEPFKLGNDQHADEPYYSAMAEQFRLFKAGGLWMERFCAEHAAERYRALTRPDPSLGGDAETVWHSPSETPAIPPNSEQYFIVAVRRSHNGKVWSFPATYINAMNLHFEEDEEYRTTTGWFDARSNDDGDGETYHPLLTTGDELLAWTPVPKFSPDQAPLPPPSLGMEDGPHVPQGMTVLEIGQRCGIQGEQLARLANLLHPKADHLLAACTTPSGSPLGMEGVREALAKAHDILQVAINWEGDHYDRTNPGHPWFHKATRLLPKLRQALASISTPGDARS